MIRRSGSYIAHGIAAHHAGNLEAAQHDFASAAEGSPAMARANRGLLDGAAPTAKAVCDDSDRNREKIAGRSPKRSEPSWIPNRERM